MLLQEAIDHHVVIHRSLAHAALGDKPVMLDQRAGFHIAGIDQGRNPRDIQLSERVEVNPSKEPSCQGSFQHGTDTDVGMTVIREDHSPLQNPLPLVADGKVLPSPSEVSGNPWGAPVRNPRILAENQPRGDRQARTCSLLKTIGARFRRSGMRDDHLRHTQYLECLTTFSE